MSNKMLVRSSVHGQPGWPVGASAGIFELFILVNTADSKESLTFVAGEA